MSLISVSAHSIDAAGLKLDAELPVAWLDDELSDASVTATAPGHFTTRLSSTEAPGGHGGKAIVVRGHVRASLTTPCARCTRPAAIDVDTEMTLLLQPVVPAKPAAKPVRDAQSADRSTDRSAERKGKRKEPEEEYEFTAEEADTDTYDGETVVLDTFVREAILLEVPNFPLCSEDCPGIGPAAEPVPESPSTLDPRLAPLAALRDGLRAKLSKEKKE